MVDDELAELRRKKLEQFSDSRWTPRCTLLSRSRCSRRWKPRSSVMRSILTPEARERLSSIRMTSREFVTQIENQLIMLAQSGRLRSAITDEQLKAILKQAQPKKRDIKITRI